MLPDASTGQGPGTLDEKLSRCQEGMAWFLPSGYKYSELYECRGTRPIGSRKQVKVYKVLLRILARSRYKSLQICQRSKSKSKNRDKQMTFIVCVSGWFVIFSLTIRSPVKQSLCLKSIIQDHPIVQSGQHHRCKKAFLYQQIG